MNNTKELINTKEQIDHLIQILCAVCDYHGEYIFPYNTKYIKNKVNLRVRADMTQFKLLVDALQILLLDYYVLNNKKHPKEHYFDVIFDTYEKIKEKSLQKEKNLIKRSEYGRFGKNVRR